MPRTSTMVSARDALSENRLSTASHASSRSRPRRNLKRIEPADRAEELAEVIADMYNRMEPKDSPNLRFLCDDDLIELLNSYRDPIFSFETWERDQTNLVIRESRKFLATLLLSNGFTLIKSIRALFFEKNGQIQPGPVIIDRDSYFKTRSELEFLRPFLPRSRRDEFLDHFLETQYLVKPYTFTQRATEESLEIPSKARLPFKQEQKNIGVGGYGRVSKVLVARTHYVTSQGKIDLKDEWCALKQIKSQGHFLKEDLHLRILKESFTTDHNHVLKHYASFIHGNTFNILLPLAELYDLEVFLNEGYKPSSPKKEKLYEFHEKFPNFDRKYSGQCILDIFSQFLRVADAVKWLHSGTIKGLSMVHMDLKPANIVIKEDRSNNPYSVGIWYITDFGISVPKAPGRIYLTIADALQLVEPEAEPGSHAFSKRISGTYLPPETERTGHGTTGPKIDVWSLGCIFSELLTFALCGRDGVAEFSRLRGLLQKDDGFYYKKLSDRRQKINGDQPIYQVRSAVTRWLRDLTSEHSAYGPWVACGSELVLRTLICNHEDRPNAKDFAKLVEHAMDHYQNPEEPFGESCKSLTRQTSATSGLSENSASGRRSSSHTSWPSSEQERQRRRSGDSIQPSPRQYESEPAHRPSPVRTPSLSSNRERSYSLVDPEPTARHGEANSTPPQHDPTSFAEPNDLYHGYQRSRQSHAHSAPDMGDGVAHVRQRPFSHEVHRLPVPHRSPRRVPSDMELHPLPVPHRSARPVPSDMELHAELVGDNEFYHRNNNSRSDRLRDVAICPIHQRTLWLFDSSMVLSGLMSSQRDDKCYYLPKGISWEQVELAGHYAAVRGYKECGSFYVLMYGLDSGQEVPLPGSTDRPISSLDDMLVSTTGFIALRGGKELLLYDIRLGSRRYIPLSTGEGRTFGKLAFSSSGFELVAWAYGSKPDGTHLPNAIYYWQLDEASREVKITRKYYVDHHQSVPRPVSTLLLVSSSREGLPLDCILRKSDSPSSFFRVRLNDTSGSTLDRYYLTRNLNSVERATIYKESHLIVLTKRTTTFFKKRDQVNAYPLYGENNGKQAPQSNPLIELDSLADRCKIAVTWDKHDDCENLMIAGLHGKVRRIRLQ